MKRLVIFTQKCSNCMY